MALHNINDEYDNYNHTLEEYNASIMNVSQPRETPMSIPSGIVSDGALDIFTDVIHIWLTSIIGYVGIVANTIAIIAFAKQGYRETINISLTTIALWDLLKCICCVLTRLYAPIRQFSIVTAASVGTIANYVMYYLFSYSNHVSCMLAGYLAIERSLCVSRPFHVKFIVSRKNITLMNVLTSLVVFGSIVVSYSRYEITWAHNDRLNATLATMTVRTFQNREIVSQYYDVISIAYPVIAFVIICVCTGIIYYYLRKSVEFRAKTTLKKPETISSEKEDRSNDFHLSSRDRRIIKLLFIILIVYVINIIPRLARYGIKMFVPEFYYGGPYSNLYRVGTYFMYLFDLINGTVNPFIYFFMSSEFKKTVQGMFCKVPKT